jgi:uncharacterized protein YcfJ
MDVSMLVRPCARAATVLVAVTLVACTRPLTLEECQQRSDALNCMDNTVLFHTAQNAVVGGIIGAAVGGGIGYAVGGPVGATRGAIAGAVGGGAVGGAITYYVEHREANALADINARNRKLDEFLRAYQDENKKLQDQAGTLQTQLAQATTEGAQLEQLRIQLKTEREANQAFLQRVNAATSSIEAERQQFIAAVNYAREHGLSIELGSSLANHQGSQAGFAEIQRETQMRVNLDNGRYE